MVGVVGIGGGDAGEHVLVALAGQQVAILEGLLAEGGQQIVTRPVQLQGRHHRQQRAIGRVRSRNRLEFNRLQSFAASHCISP